MRRARVTVATLLVATVLPGCARRAGSDAPSVDASVSAPVASASTPDAPVRARPRTTSPAIALGNLDADIAERQRRDVPDPEQRLRLVDLLLARAQFMGRVRDLEDADALASRAVTRDPKNAHAQLARAHVDAALHRFDRAERGLDAALRAGAPEDRVAKDRAAIALAVGRYEGARAIVLASPIEAEGRAPGDVVVAAVLAARTGDPARATELFDLARARLVDPSPFTLAWMDVQRASVLESLGEDAAARTWLEEACEVLPGYAHAAVHLAAYEAPRAAVTRLEALSATSDDPDVLAALGDAHARAGDEAAAERARAAATKRFDEVLARFEEAYADHAARFFLVRDAPERALRLARGNATRRPTEEALALWMSAATGAGDRSGACVAAARMAALPYLTSPSRRLADAAGASPACRGADAGGRDPGK